MAMIIAYDRTTTGMGRGVFARRRLRAGDLIERVPVIVVPAPQCHLVAATILDSYDYKWGEDGMQRAIALGYGSLYNHSYQPNAHYTKLFENLEIIFVALKTIEEGQEITINYNGSPHDQRKIIFEGAMWWTEAERRERELGASMASQ
jgi:SET domain-containing protein